jgi:hypothetical protein
MKILYEVLIRFGGRPALHYFEYNAENAEEALAVAEEELKESGRKGEILEVRKKVDNDSYVEKFAKRK